jgi:hypothetical protein
LTTTVRTFLLVAVAAAAGSLAVAAVVPSRAAEYAAEINVAAATRDLGCRYFHCPLPTPGLPAAGDPYVLDQANAIERPDIARRVRGLDGSPLSEETLLANVSAKEIGRSRTIVITYTARTDSLARRIAEAYARAYVAWSRRQAAAALATVIDALAAARSRAVEATVRTLRQAQLGSSGGSPPEAASLYPGEKATISSSTEARTRGVAEFVFGALGGAVAALGAMVLARRRAAAVELQ